MSIVEDVHFLCSHAPSAHVENGYFIVSEEEAKAPNDNNQGNACILPFFSINIQGIQTIHTKCFKPTINWLETNFNLTIFIFSDELTYEIA